MDQAVIAFAAPGAALRIDFEPPARRTVPLPEGLALIVAYSGEAAAKGGEARAAYNALVIGARFAAALLCEMIGLDPSSPPRLADVATLPPNVLKGLVKHPLTDKGLEAFLADWKKTGQSILDK